MSNNFKDNKFKELLDKLQQESWQLELLISGFAIFGLITSIPHIRTAMIIAENDRQIYSFVALLIAFIACSVLIFNLLVHVILRGLWIGSLGLRYVSGDIDFEKLNYQNKFTNYLRKKIVSFDKYVATLENYCSVLFAISFLLIFYVISISIISLCIVGIATLILSNDNLPEVLRTIIGVFLLFFILIGALLVFIDFLTQGYLKKKKWLSKIYFPFYWVFSFLTLTFLYRPLVYNFLDNKFTRRLSLFLVPSYIAISILISFKHNKTNYLESAKHVTNTYIDAKNYEDLLINDDDFPRIATIQSKVITEPYIKLFRVFTESVEDRLYSYHPSLKPKEDKRGFKTDIVMFNSTESMQKRDSLTKKYLEVFNNTHQVYIDTLKLNSDFLIAKNKKEQFGFETYINLKNISDGKHILKLKRLKKRKKDTLKVTDISIPFWYFKQ
ncbi:hypothetical protein [Polaribacter sp. Hel1_85]|uniref:hypothetical protein n=1 Tax=Polaribacter sp. Hel1_85 TaxID=1250005 RepID=UPI00052CE1FA|nr:hypothetical protein [Polaribacter sp. Hel1_85]KGL64161.1 conserved hypothetical membrane protein [Polaribacter sp. Hel1_85]